MKFWLVSLLAFAVSGCATQQAATAYRVNPMDGCSTIAEQRVQDQAYLGYSADLQKQIFNDTYAACSKEEAGYITRVGLHKP